MNAETPAAPVGDAPKRQATICNRRGLHARAAAKFVKLAATFDAQVSVSHRGTEVSGLSIMGLMMLAAAPGCCIELAADGPQAAEALDALCGLIAQKFDEED
ncbi:HPr family phosphocarrier protein [Magnetospirillum sp. UT-4]|uniref:HPr family phosphocarrier protein n=1 Tax=Magnetospirillum sp. UT-4 TaxID=2681467 RepID=UPI0013808AB5|nr:HPr family phosphocarrier protein [Magnetospirillum sp. UT-4]CAA7617590.1 phosphohistidinoprotein-hexose phosphotransferase component of N-regulated PTS system (Npr) [Magnetospirillum sp. UT-4]